MSNEQSQKPEQAPEGEGSYSATRRYNRHLADAIEGSDLEAGAEAAREGDGRSGTRGTGACRGARQRRPEAVSNGDEVTRNARPRNAVLDGTSGAVEPGRFASV